MPKRGAIALTLTTVALVLLINFRVPADGATVSPATRTGTTVSGGSTSGSGGSTSDSAGTSGGSDTPEATSPTADVTLDGPVVDTRYGPVQVEVTISDGAITGVSAIVLPSGGRSGQISNSAEPILRSEALQAQSASIDGVSGATYTSEAYAESLQAALDDAGYTG